ncbi:hypothetical protein PsexTeo8_65280 [Pseudomonas extremaustralis]|uniref:carbohydrate kinase family protein n=1 Tax=Pseudomonas extremaustralis TaxID=359110 RepID=UPI002AA0CA46|nr:carbohydrate kinase family protein [Pseudomonas extremaustralis]MDY7069848.1 hypothetical protein [Pseudomonas extremaustralis]MDY7069990.1 hypothetical protein [Pseudomonas extremaustralis]
MHIVGGLYRELCDIPFWDSTMGSGARAALAAISLSPNIEFTTYASPPDRPAITALRSKGIIATIHARPSPIVFAYFHPLSSPHLEPARDKIVRLPSLQVSGEAVLRFGFLEGDAIVTAGRAVYDPQTWRDPQPFAANGSNANELALVMNELEMREATGIKDIDQAARHLIETQKAQVIVVKKGAWGASVYEADGTVSNVPAYRSGKIFKIGTGDIFSAVFAFYWAEKKLRPVQAADLASRSVSLYCETYDFQFDQASLELRQPVLAKAGATIRLEGRVETIGQRFTMEEACFALRELGMCVVCPELALGSGSSSADATLVINDGLSPESLARITNDQVKGTPIIELCATSKTSRLIPANPWSTDDFTTAMYYSAWAAGTMIINT